MGRSKIVFATILLTVFLSQGNTFGQGTEVIVLKGKVKAVTKEGTVTVTAGQKGILKQGESPRVTVDDPLVKDLLQMDKWVQAEKEAQRMRIDHATIQIYAFENENLWKGAALFESPWRLFKDRYSRETGTLKIGPTLMSADSPFYEFYDMEGKKISFDVERATEMTAYLYLHLPEPIQAENTLKFVAVTESEPPTRTIWKEGKLWHLQAGNPSPHALNYYRVILPKSAIFLDSNFAPLSADDVDGRTAITIRNYTGKEGEGTYHITFLWPEKDGTSLQDLPPEYRGLRNSRDIELAEHYEREMAKILAGVDYRDQSTPIATLLARNSSIVRNDKELYADGSYSLQKDPKRKEAFLKDSEKDLRDSKPYFVDNMTFLSTPPWPERPEEGYLHPIYMSYPGSLIRRDMLVFIYHKGEWYSIGNEGDPWNTDVSVFEKFK